MAPCGFAGQGIFIEEGLTEMTTKQAFEEVKVELLIAQASHVPFNSSHEGYAVLKEEVDELWDEVKSNCPDRAREEAVQVAAMAIRFLIDIG